jgi:nucleotide-binding universal stress UspA family protein
MIRLRAKRPDLDRGFRVPLYPGLSILGIILLLFLAIYMFNYSLIAWGVTATWIVTGLLVYKGYASKRELEHLKKVQALERIERKEYSILVCLSNPEAVRGLTNIAIAIAKKHNGEIIFLHVIEVQEGQPLAAGIGDTARVNPLLEEAESLAAESGIYGRSIIQVSHRVSQAIVETALLENCNFILIRRPRQLTFLGRVFSSLMDTVLQKAPTEVAVLHGEIGEKKIRKILVPFGTSIHTRLATEIAPALRDHFDAELHIVVVFDVESLEHEREKRIEEIREVMQQNSLVAELDVVLEKDILAGILKHAADVDLVLMGGRTGDFLELLLSRSLTEDITEKVRCPVVWVREYEEPRSLWSRILKPTKTEKVGK